MSRHYNSQRKKIRGWKRRVEHLNWWGEQIKQPYTKYFITERGRHTYERYRVSPFYRLIKRQPPLWFYKLIIAKIVAAYDNWQQTFDDLGIPYDLQLWIYDPDFIRSEIICYKMEEAGERKQFSWESTVDKPFPYNKFASKFYDLNKFEWLLADDEPIQFEDDCEDADFTVEDLLKEGYVKKEQNNGGIYYAKRLGDIWIGRRKSLNADGARYVPQEYYPIP